MDCLRATNQTEDFALYSPSRFGMLGRPLYKPENDITFLYGQCPDAGGGVPDFRVIPTDREHGQNAEFAATYFGDTVGCWEGDTLVLDSHRHDMDRARRLLPFLQDAHRRKVQA